MEEEKGKAMDIACPGKQLDFNAPLLSIKRHGSSIGEENCCTNNSRGIGKFQDTSDRIPFSWERIAGKPKDSEKSDSIIQDDDAQQEFSQDNSCEADVDDDYGDKNDDLFSDAAEVLSLTEAMDIVEKAEKGHGLDGFNSESLGHNQCISPSYIIDRFLPDAAALATSSVLSVSESLKKLPCNHPQACVPQAVRRSYSMPKGCGLEMLFPWRIKHRICGVKSPVRQRSSANVQQDHEQSARSRNRFH
ncbi:hypothetical protein CISIN_1g035889mg [Citrus sinensis]|uniref:Uncharacterized protein n=1 Tax=Citrus sinensis TaxID=2711 RepID=A0A067ENU7_CITSI|nr:hypothetical protein CISIN_1g035889mg [Citrus sinensis]